MKFCSCDICKNLYDNDELEICIVCKTKYCNSCCGYSHNYCNKCNTKIFKKKFDKFF